MTAAMHARAEEACREFRKAKNTQLLAVAGERKTAKQAASALRARYDRLLLGFLGAPGTTYAAWLEHGPKADLDELVGALQDAAVWDRLVDGYAARAHRGAGGVAW